MLARTESRLLSMLVRTLPRAHQSELGGSSQRLRKQNKRVETSVKPAVDMGNRRPKKLVAQSEDDTVSNPENRGR